MKRRLMPVLVLLIGTTALPGQDIPLTKILVSGEGWNEVAKGWPGITFLQGMPSGEVQIYQAGKATGRITGGKVETGQPSVPVPSRTQQVAIAGQATGTPRFYTIDAERKTVTRSPGTNVEPLRLPGLIAPNCLALWPDEGHLVIGEADGAYLWAVRIEKDGSFGPGDRYYSLRTRPEHKLPVTAMTLDAGYLLYAATPLGLQIFDPTGRLSGVVPVPSREPITALTIGGEKADTLYVATGERIYARRIQGKAGYTLKKEK